MAIPAYLWLKDDDGADIKGSVDIYGREGSIEIIGLNHGVAQPTDKHNGKMYKDGKLIETGYSGALTNKNNPDRQHVKGLGPLPRGTYKIAGHSNSKGPITIILEQTSGESFGRSEFRIHGDHKYGPAGFASEGCIILSPSTRRKILRDGGELEVVR